MRQGKAPTMFTARISRHLLFNALNAAVSLCRRSPQDAAELLIKLSECLIYTSEEKEEYVSLRDELDFVQSYLHIQSIRYGKRLGVEYRINSESQGMLPPYAIYSCLENIFSEVMMKTRKKLTVTLTLDERDGEIKVTVQDSEGTSVIIDTIRSQT